MAKTKKDITNEIAEIKENEHEIQSGDEVELPSGIKIKVFELPPGLMMRVLASRERPEPPKQVDPERDRVIVNVDDEDYLNQLEHYNTQYSEAMITAMIAYGTEFVSAPKRLGSPKSDDWLDKFSLLGMPIHKESDEWRYLNWMMTVAIAADFEMITEVIGRLSGIRDEDVQAAADFPGRN